MRKEDLQTDQIILEAARKVFQRSGLGGSRMQEIADEAGINKASLHYYYRSKEKLFQTVFRQDFQKFKIPLVSILRDPALTLEERIRSFVGSYIKTLSENPGLPLFIMQELSSNPDRLISLVEEKLLRIAEETDQKLDFTVDTLNQTSHKSGHANNKSGHANNKSGHKEHKSDDSVHAVADKKEEPFLGLFICQIRDGMKSGKLNRVDPEQFILSLISMCVFPFVGRPMVRLLLRKDEQQYKGFLIEREKEINEYLFRILFKNCDSLVAE